MEEPAVTLKQHCPQMNDSKTLYVSAVLLNAPTLCQYDAFQETTLIFKFSGLLIAFQWQPEDLQQPKTILEWSHRRGHLAHLAIFPGYLFHASI